MGDWKGATPCFCCTRATWRRIIKRQIIGVFRDLGLLLLLILLTAVNLLLLVRFIEYIAELPYQGSLEARPSPSPPWAAPMPHVS